VPFTSWQPGPSYCPYLLRVFLTPGPPRDCLVDASFFCQLFFRFFSGATFFAAPRPFGLAPGLFFCSCLNPLGASLVLLFAVSAWTSCGIFSPADVPPALRRGFLPLLCFLRFFPPQFFQNPCRLFSTPLRALLLANRTLTVLLVCPSFACVSKPPPGPFLCKAILLRPYDSLYRAIPLVSYDNVRYFGPFPPPFFVLCSRFFALSRWRVFFVCPSLRTPTSLTACFFATLPPPLLPTGPITWSFFLPALEELGWVYGPGYNLT